VGIIVPVLNEAAMVPELVRQLSSLRPAQVVVVDGGSNDGTAEAIRAAGFPVLAAPRGRARQMNAGAEQCDADVLLFLHADTRLLPSALPLCAEAAATGAVGGCFRLRIDSRDARLWAASQIITWRSRLLPSASGDQAIFVRRDTFHEIGGYREIALCEDLDLVARLARRGRFVCLPEYAETSARRWRRNGVARTIALMWALRLGWHLGVPADTLGKLYNHEVR
jgi:rSAM/selenodomain-associated transferase 2